MTNVAPLPETFNSSIYVYLISMSHSVKACLVPSVTGIIEEEKVSSCCFVIKAAYYYVDYVYEKISKKFSSAVWLIMDLFKTRERNKLEPLI